MAKHGRKTVFKLADGADVLQDLSQYMNTSALQRTIESHETTTYQKDAKTYIPGLKDATIPIGGVWDPVLDAHMNAILQQPDKAFEFGPGGGQPGDVKYSGVCIVTEYSINPPVGDTVTWSGQLQVSDDVTRGTFT